MAALQGREYIEFDPLKPEEVGESMNKAVAYINKLRLQKERGEFIRTILIAVFIALVVIMAFYAIQKR